MYAIGYALENLHLGEDDWYRLVQHSMVMVNTQNHWAGWGSRRGVLHLELLYSLGVCLVEVPDT